jgi:hypothetical protein
MALVAVMALFAGSNAVMAQGTCDTDALRQLAKDLATDGIYSAINFDLATCQVNAVLGTPTVVQAPTTADNSVPAGNNSYGWNPSMAPCELDKIATWSEVSGSGPQRIEVGGNGTQHFDLYPARGVPAISFIIRPQEPDIYMGFGSGWEGNGAACESFDYVADATKYAEGRLNNGHSGLVMDWATGEILANVNNMTEDQISKLLELHKAALGDSAMSAPVSGTEQDNSVVPASGQTSQSTVTVAACTATRYGENEGNADGLKLTVPAGTTYVVPAWEGPGGKTMDETNLIFGSGMLVSGYKGALWVYPCDVTNTQASLELEGKTSQIVQ